MLTQVSLLQQFTENVMNGTEGLAGHLGQHLVWPAVVGLWQFRFGVIVVAHGWGGFHRRPISKTGDSQVL